MPRRVAVPPSHLTHPLAPPLYDVLPFSHNLYVFRTLLAAIKIYDAHGAFAIATLQVRYGHCPSLLYYYYISFL